MTMKDVMRFELTEEQKKRVEEWFQEHKCDADPGSIGGKFSYIITPTGLGDCVMVKCLCGESIDLTNVDNW